MILRTSKLLVLMVALSSLSCGSDGGGGGTGSNPDDDNTNAEILTYVGPQWEYIRQGTKFSVTEPSFSGSVSSLPSGHVKLSVEQSSGGTAPAKGTTLYALESSGVVAFIRPEGGVGETVPLVFKSSCPQSDVMVNWVRAKGREGVDENTAAFVGTTRVTLGSGQVNHLYRYALEGLTDVGAQVGPALQCEQGRASDFGSCDGEVEDNDPTTYYFGPSQVTLWGECIGTNFEKHVLGLPEQNLSDLSVLDGNYAGLMYDELEDTTTPLSATFSTDTSALTFETRSGTDLQVGGSVFEFEIEFADDPKKGFLAGYVDRPTDQARFVCTPGIDLGDEASTLIYCVGQSPVDNSQRITALFLKTE